MIERAARRSVVDAGLVAGLTVLLAALYATTVKGLALEWASSPDSSYGAILAAVAGALLWKRRHAVAAAARRPVHTTAGLVLLAFGVLVYAAGSLGADVFLTRVSLVCVAAGCVWWLGGSTAMRIAAAPLAFLMLAVPLPALVVNAITLPLQLVASRIAESLLVAANVPVFRDGNVLELRSTTLEVAQACSGLRSLISLTAIACLVAWAAEPSKIRRALVVASALPIAITLNGIRIAATGIACETWGPQMASGGWHEFTGWLTFAAAVAVLTLFQRVLPRPRVQPAITVEAVPA